ncbi:hypothetical protein GB937_010560 [Aspergillus fischeri]|nr:hypothetical protein GB937_010560 [Aspergillus fischeri]
MNSTEREGDTRRHQIAMPPRRNHSSAAWHKVGRDARRICELFSLVCRPQNTWMKMANAALFSWGHVETVFRTTSAQCSLYLKKVVDGTKD